MDEDEDVDVVELIEVEKEEISNKVTAILAHATIVVSVAISSNFAVFV